MELTIIRAGGDMKLPNGLYAKDARILFDPKAVSLKTGVINCDVYVCSAEQIETMGSMTDRTLFTLPVSISVLDLPTSAQQALLGVLFPALQQAIKSLLAEQFSTATFSIE